MTARYEPETRVRVLLEAEPRNEREHPGCVDQHPEEFCIVKITRHEYRPRRNGKWHSDVRIGTPFIPEEVIATVTRDQLAAFIGDAAGALARS